MEMRSARNLSGKIVVGAGEIFDEVTPKTAEIEDGIGCFPRPATLGLGPLEEFDGMVHGLCLVLAREVNSVANDVGV